MIRNISLYGKGVRPRPYPVLLRTPPVSFPKATGFFGGIADIHGFRQRTPIYFNRLAENQAWYDR
jgi:hypothetical protein